MKKQMKSLLKKRVRIWIQRGERESLRMILLFNIKWIEKRNLRQRSILGLDSISPYIERSLIRIPREQHAKTKLTHKKKPSMKTSLVPSYAGTPKMKTYDSDDWNCFECLYTSETGRERPSFEHNNGKMKKKKKKRRELWFMWKMNCRMPCQERAWQSRWSIDKFQHTLPMVSEKYFFW